MSVLGSLFPAQSVGHLEQGTENVPLWLLSLGPICVTRADLFGPVLSSFVPSSGAPFSCQRRRLPGSGIYICSSTWLSNPPYQITRSLERYIRLAFRLRLHSSKFNMPSSSKRSL